MAKQRTVFVCQACGATAQKWLGRCTACGEWNSLQEEAVAGGGGAGGPHGGGGQQAAGELRSQPIGEVTEHSGDAPRHRCGLAAVDRVLGGGIVVGSVVLLGGDPGIGKSTLVLQALHGLAQAGAGVLYVSGEESVAQTALRARRLGATSKGLRVLAEVRLEAILAEARRLRPAVMVVDSIQMVQVEDAPGGPGSVGHVREATARLVPFAKEHGVAVVLVGHMTKEGGLAGPKTLEHMVDVVLLFEGERGHPYRILRGSKNRFGATGEIGVFEMRGEGLVEVPDPSALFLAERPVGVPGSAVTATIEGSLPILCEVQALVAHAVTVPRRTALGMDPNRVAMLLAVVERRAGIDLLALDVFVNVAGGMRLDEPAADLAVAAALASSATGRPVDEGTACFGEIGLAGEVRAVMQPEPRLIEAAKLGFRRCVMPEASMRLLRRRDLELEIVGVRDVQSAIEALLPRRK